MAEAISLVRHGFVRLAFAAVTTKRIQQLVRLDSNAEQMGPSNAAVVAAGGVHRTELRSPKMQVSKQLRDSQAYRSELAQGNGDTRLAKTNPIRPSEPTHRTGSQHQGVSNPPTPKLTPADSSISGRTKKTTHVSKEYHD